MEKHRKYTNLIIFSVLIIGIATFFIIKYVNFSEILLKIGYYDSKITIGNTADIHGHLVYDDEVGTYYTADEVSYIMGMPLIKHYADEVRKDNKNTLFLDCGDAFHGTNEANVDEGEGVVECLNTVGYSAMVPGNHDFNFGTDRLLEIEKELNYPILSANIYRDGKLLFDEYKIVEVGGYKIGLFGLSTSILLGHTHDKSLSVEDPVEAAKRVVPELKKQTDLVIMLSHLGNDIDENIIKNVDGIDLVFGGHYHLLYDEVKKINDTYYMSAGSFTTHFGIADIYFKDDKIAKINWSLETTTDKKKGDKDVDVIAEKYHEIALELGKEVLGKSTVDLDGIRGHSRSQETNFANLITDAMKETGNAEITLFNGGGIRESVPAGDITLYQTSNALPFTNSLVVLEMKGDKIYDAIERGLRRYPSSSNGPFLQVSGISYEIDGSKEAGQRLVRVMKDGQPLDKEKTYLVATNDFLYYGGDDYTEFKDAKLVNTLGLLKDVLSNYIKTHGVVSPQNESRITVINARYK